MQNGLKIIALSGLLFGSVAISSAEIAFTSLSPDDSYNVNSTIFIGKYSTNSIALQQGFMFESLATGQVSKIRVGITDFTGEDSVGSVPTFDLYASDLNQASTLLGSWTGTAPTGSSLQTLTSSDVVTLTAGTSYWLVAREPDPTKFFGWNNTNTGLALPKLLEFGAGSGFSYSSAPEDAGAFEITVGGAVPEPASMIALGLGALALVRRKRK